jgi:hypothetical protein
VNTAMTGGRGPLGPSFTRRRALQIGGLFTFAAATVGSLSACGSSSGGGGPKKITWATGNDTLSIPHWKKAAEEFMADNPGVEINFTLIPDGPLDAWLVASSLAWPPSARAPYRPRERLDDAASRHRMGERACTTCH